MSQATNIINAVTRIIDTVSSYDRRIAVKERDMERSSKRRDKRQTNTYYAKAR